MGLFLTLAFLFFIGSVCGWVLELFYRRFFSDNNPERKWINPGFCTGPYVPLYGFGLAILYLIATLERYSVIQSPFWNKALLFAVMALCMTAIEYIAGVLSLRVAKVRLWDYSGEWGNLNGLICPKFSLAWALLGGGYYFLVHPYILDALGWMSRNLSFSFVIGLYFGVFIIDVAHAAQLTVRLRAFAAENDVVIKYENLKAHLRGVHDRTAQKYHFFRPFHSARPLHEHLTELKQRLEEERPSLTDMGVFSRRDDRKK